jgi:hypothetical protein
MAVNINPPNPPFSKGEIRAAGGLLSLSQRACPWTFTRPGGECPFFQRGEKGFFKGGDSGQPFSKGESSFEDFSPFRKRESVPFFQRVERDFSVSPFSKIDSERDLGSLPMVLDFKQRGALWLI